MESEKVAFPRQPTPAPSLAMPWQALFTHSYHWPSTSIKSQCPRENISASSTEFINPPPPHPSCESTRGGGPGWWGGLGGGVGSQQGQTPKKDALLLCCEVSVRSPLGRAHSAALSPFNQASCKAVISLFKYSPVGCSHIHNLMTLIMHISEKNRWHCFAGVCC